MARKWRERPPTLLRLLRGRTLTDVAQTAALPLTIAWVILNGQVNPSFDSGIAIAKALGLTAEDLHRVLVQIRQERAAVLENIRAAEWQERRQAISRLMEKARFAASRRNSSTG